MPIYYDPGKKQPPPDPDKSPAARVSFGGYKPVIGTGGYQENPNKPKKPYQFNIGASPQWLQNFMYKPDKPSGVTIPGYGSPMQLSQSTRLVLGLPLQSAFLLGDWFNKANRTSSLAQHYQPAGGTAGPYSYPADLGGESYFNAAGMGTKPPTTTDPNYGRGRGTNRRDRPDWASNYDYSISQMGYGSGGMFGTLPKSTDADLPPKNPPPLTSGGYPYDYYGWGGGGGGGYSYGFGSAKKSWYSDLLNWRI